MLYKNLYYLLLSIVFIRKVFLINIKIKNDTESMENFADTLNNISTVSDYEEIKVLFEDDYYKLATFGRNIFNVYTNIIFYSEKGTIFDFQGNQKSELNFLFQAYNKKIKFQNITFYNHCKPDKISYMIYFNIPFENNEYQIEFDNCTFRDNQGLLLSFSHICTKSSQTDPQALFNNCNFM